MKRFPVLLDGEMNPVRALQPVSLRLTWQAKPLSSAVLKMMGKPPEVGSWVRLPLPDGTGAIFRVEEVSRSPEGGSTVRLYHGLISLQDSMLLTELRHSGSLGEVLSALLENQSLWQAGTLPEESPCSWLFSRGNLLTAVLRLT